MGGARDGAVQRGLARLGAYRASRRVRWSMRARGRKSRSRAPPIYIKSAPLRLYTYRATTFSNFSLSRVTVAGWHRERHAQLVHPSVYVYILSAVHTDTVLHTPRHTPRPMRCMAHGWANRGLGACGFPSASARREKTLDTSSMLSGELVPPYEEDGEDAEEEQDRAHPNLHGAGKGRGALERAGRACGGWRTGGRVGPPLCACDGASARRGGGGRQKAAAVGGGCPERTV